MTIKPAAEELNSTRLEAKLLIWHPACRIYSFQSKLGMGLVFFFFLSYSEETGI